MLHTPVIFTAADDVVDSLPVVDADFVEDGENAMLMTRMPRLMLLTSTLMLMMRTLLLTLLLMMMMINMNLLLELLWLMTCSKGEILSVC